jgi:hypothetical protein
MASEQSSGEARESGLAEDVRVVPMCGEQVHLNVLQDGSHRAETTCTQYLNSLRLVYRLVAGNEKAELPSNIDWIKEAGTIVNAVRERQNNTTNAAWSPGSLCNKLTPLMAISKLRKWDEAYEHYFAAFLLAKNKQNNQTISQTPTQREQDNWIEMTEIKAKMEDLGRKIRRQIVHTYQLGRPLERDDIKKIFQHLVLAANTLEPPKRRDYSNLPLQKPDGSFYSAGAQGVYEQSGNVLKEYSKDSYVLTLTSFKTASKHGRVEFELSKRLSTYIKRSLILVPRPYFLTRLNDPTVPMSDNYLSRFVADIKFSKGRYLTMNHLRHVYISDAFKGDHSISQREAVAKRMLHDWSTAMKTYERKHRALPRSDPL